MSKPFLLFSAVALFAFAPVGPPAGAQQNSAPAANKSSTKASSDLQSKVKKLYAIDCALCHGDAGDGKTDLAKDMALTLVDWTDPKSLSDRQDEELFNIIRNGKGKMPSEDKGRATDDEIKGLITYIRRMAKDQPATPAAASTTPAPSNQ
jgi:mono/diheme cytochrome c family protein